MPRFTVARVSILPLLALLLFPTLARMTRAGTVGEPPRTR